MRRLKAIAAVVFVAAYFGFGEAALRAHHVPPSCQDSDYCEGGQHWKTRHCTWNESNNSTCQDVWWWLQLESQGCGGGPWFGYVNDFNCTDTGDFPWTCGHYPPDDPDQCQSEGSATCTATDGYC